MHISRFCLLIFGASLLLSARVEADVYRQAFEDQATPVHEFRLAPELNYSSTSSNYDLNGAVTQPVGLTSLTTLGVNVYASYGIYKNLTLLGRLSWKDLSLSSQSTQSTAYGFGDQMIGAGYRLFEISNWALDFQTQLEIPTYNNTQSRTDSDPLMGDQSTDFTVGGFVHGKLWQGETHDLILDTGGGYRYRMSGYSSDIPWSLNAKYSPHDNGWLLGVRFFGMLSMQNDSRVISTSAAPGSGTGGSFMSEAKNPSMTWAGAELGYRIDPNWLVQIHGDMTLNGKDAPDTVMIAGGIQLSFGGPSDSKEQRPHRQSPEQYGKSNQGFIEYSFEGKVTSTNDRLSLIKIDKGTESGVAIGQTYDVFRVNEQGEAKDVVARTRVKSVKEGQAVLSVTEYFKEVWIEPGFLVKRPIQ